MACKHHYNSLHFSRGFSFFIGRWHRPNVSIVKFKSPHSWRYLGVTKSDTQFVSHILRILMFFHWIKLNHHRIFETIYTMVINCDVSIRSFWEVGCCKLRLNHLGGKKGQLLLWVMFYDYITVNIILCFLLGSAPLHGIFFFSRAKTMSS